MNLYFCTSGAPPFLVAFRCRLPSETTTAGDRQFAEHGLDCGKKAVDRCSHVTGYWVTEGEIMAAASGPMNAPVVPYRFLVDGLRGADLVDLPETSSIASFAPQPHICP